MQRAATACDKKKKKKKKINTPAQSAIVDTEPHIYIIRFHESFFVLNSLGEIQRKIEASTPLTPAWIGHPYDRRSQRSRLFESEGGNNRVYESFFVHRLGDRDFACQESRLKIF